MKFTAERINIGDATIFTKHGGSGSPVLLLHGFPETHYMWRHIATLLAHHNTVVMADLRGYGDSSCPQSTADHAPYSKRTMAMDMIRVMRQLGFSKFAVVGHDRGARVAYRMALDHPDNITHLAVLDILPTDIAWSLADSRMMVGYWPWSLFVQPAPLPERMIESAATEIVNNACDNWGSAPATFSTAVRKVYIKALQSVDHIHAICEEYRAAATIDREHDQVDRQVGNNIICPTLVLWGADGALDTWYRKNGGPLALWKTVAPQAKGEALPGGHFFAEEAPEALHEKLEQFFNE